MRLILLAVLLLPLTAGCEYMKSWANSPSNDDLTPSYPTKRDIQEYRDANTARIMAGQR